MAPPFFPDDPSKSLRAQLLSYTLWANLVLVACCVFAGLVGGHLPAFVIWAEIAFGVWSFVVRWWLFQGRVQLASGALLAAGFVVITLVIARLGTIRVPAAGFYVALVLASGCFFELRGMLLMIALSSVAVGGLIIAENFGLLPQPDYSVNITQWIATTGLFGAVGFWTFATLQTTRRALVRAESELAERRRIESSLRKTEARFRAIVEGSNDGILFCDAEAKILFRSSSYERINGFSEAERVGKNGFETVHPNDLARVRRYWQELLTSTKTAHPIEYQIRHRDGTWRWVETTAQNLLSNPEVQAIVITSRDITERKKSESRLLVSDRALRSISQGVLLAGPDRRILSANPAFTAITGFTEDEILGQTCHHLQGPLTDPVTIAAIREALQKGTEFVGEVLNYRKDGTTFINELIISPITDGEGKVAHFIGTMRDVTDRRQAEAAIRASERFTREIADTIPAMIGFWNRDLRCVFANQSYLDWFGRTVDQMIGISIQELMGPELFLKNEPYMRAALRGESQQFERTLTKPSGSQHSVWAQYRPRWVNGEVCGFFVQVTDITPLKKSQEQLREKDQRLRELLGSIDAIVWEADATTFVFTSVSENVERLLGYPLADWLQPGFWAEHIHPDDRSQALHYCATCAGQLENHEFEYRFIAKDGRVVWLRDDVKVIAAEGRPRWLRGLMVDVTATRELEQQLRQSQKLEAIGTLAGGIAHDFNNILAGVYGFTALARKAAGNNPELVGYLDEIARGGRRAAELVRQILTFSRARGGDLAMAPIRLEHIVEEALKLLRATTPSTIEFKTTLAPNLPGMFGSASQLHQVVMNLGTNAVQAIGARPGRLSVTLEESDVDEALARVLPDIGPGRHLRLIVSDTGSGISQANQARVFEPFFTTKAPGEGTGLGLSVVHGIVRNHHGAIRLVSETERGSTFEIFLPVAQGLSAPEPPTLREAPQGRGERILFVDDEIVVIQVGKLALAGLGYAVETEINAVLALDRLKKDPWAFDLVITDQTMPNLTGMEFARQIRALRPDLPVILSSGHDATLTVERIHESGVREFLAKPYTIETLADTVQRHLGRRQEARQPTTDGPKS